MAPRKSKQPPIDGLNSGTRAHKLRLLREAVARRKARKLLAGRQKGINWRLLRAVRNRIAKHPETFYMPNYLNTFAELRARGVRRSGPACRTAGCIAGEAVLIRYTPIIDTSNKHYPSALEEVDTPAGRESVHSVARDLLGLSYGQANYLFGGEWHERRTRVTARQTVAYLDKLLAGKVHLPVRRS
jgi:hypothetical protein